MSLFPKFTQYYIISIIFPGVFNALLTMYTLKLTFYKDCKYLFQNYEWFFFMFSSIILTYCLGMLIEKRVYKLIPCKKNNPKVVSFENLQRWRKKLFIKVNKKEEILANLYVNYTEKLMAEYYCFNNIIIGIVISFLIFFLYYILHINDSCLNVCMVIFTPIILFFVILLILCAMRTWLFELESLQNDTPKKAEDNEIQK